LGDYEKATAYWQESMEISITLGMQHTIAWVFDCLALAAWGQGDLATAQKYLEDAVDLFRAIGIPSAVAMCLAELALVLRSAGEVEQAVALARQAIAIVRDTDNQMMLALSLNYLGAALIGAGDGAAARRALTEAIQLASAGQYTFHLVNAFYYFAELLVLESHNADLPLALERRGLAVTLLSCVRTQTATWQVYKDKAAQLQAEIEGALPAELFSAAVQRGESCTLQEMVNTLLGDVPAALIDDPKQAP
jgi:tetratricopeptide (TPR) repeat protein